MRTSTPIVALAASFGATLVSARPSTVVDLTPLNFPAGAIPAMLEKRDLSLDAECPSTPNSCGVVTFKSGTFTTFGQGTCMQLGANVQSIYVSKCFCSLWNSCTGESAKDVYVSGMMMCEKPKKMDEFDKEVKYLSCGGMR